MPQTDYATPATPAAEALVADLFALGGVGYVALGSDQEVLMRHTPGLETDTTSTSNFFEELLVNPTLLRLAGQRARLDCGDLSYVAVGYGDFTQLILPMENGHVSLGVARTAPVREMAQQVADVLERHGRGLGPAQASLLA